MTNYKQRLSIDITPEQAQGLNKHLEYGMKKLLFHVIIDDLLALFEKHGAGVIIGALTTRAISLKNVCRLKGVEKKGKKV